MNSQLHICICNFKLLLDHLQSPESLPRDMMTSYEALCFGDICFAPPQHTLNMQWVSLTYLKSLVNDNCFQLEGIKPDSYSSSTAILVVFFSYEEHRCIQHVHIGLVVCCTGCNLHMQDRILPFVKSIEADLAKVRTDMPTTRTQEGCIHTPCLLPIMGVSWPLPLTLYYLVYPMVYNNDAEDQNHFNTAASPSGMHTHVCMCHCLLQLTDKDPDN